MCFEIDESKRLSQSPLRLIPLDKDNQFELNVIRYRRAANKKTTMIYFYLYMLWRAHFPVQSTTGDEKRRTQLPALGLEWN